MDNILSAVELQFALVYGEDVIIFFRSAQEHLDHPRIVMGVLSRPRVSLKLKECFSSKDGIDSFCQVIRPGRFGILTEATNTICSLQQATNVTHVKSSIGL